MFLHIFLQDKILCDDMVVAFLLIKYTFLRQRLFKNLLNDRSWYLTNVNDIVDNITGRKRFIVLILIYQTKVRQETSEMII
jgi:hypothetical protein